MKGRSRYLLDTNTVSYIVSGRSSAARSKLEEVSGQSPIAISVITEAEMLYGLARKPEATKLRIAVEAFLTTVQVLPWDLSAARAYGTLRRRLEVVGKTLSNLDLMIAAHAIAADAILVTSDRAFAQVEALRPTVDWAHDLRG